jgi:ribose transport system permease protein
MQSSTKNSLWTAIKKKFDFNKYIVYIIFVFVLLLFAVLLGHTFFSVSNIFNVTRQTAVISIIAVTMTFAIAAGQIDLSIGSTMALTGLVSALVLQHTSSIPLAVIAALVVGTVIGLLNGLLIVAFNIPSFLVTLGMQGIVYGIGMWTTNTVAIQITDPIYNFIFGGGDIGGMPILVLWTLAAAVIGHIVLKKMPFGKKVLATGGNAVSARFSGINVKKIIVLVMMFNSLIAGLGGVLFSGRMETARYNYGEGAELDVIAAVILGGTSMAGGTGSIIGAIVGSLLLGVINNGLVIAGLSVSGQYIIKGVLIIFAVAISSVGSLKRKAN